MLNIVEKCIIVFVAANTRTDDIEIETCAYFNLRRFQTKMKQSKNIYLSNLYGPSSSNIFNDEIDKKRFLDIVRSALEQNECQVYAFCLLEHEVYFLVGAQNQKLIKQFLNEIICEFQKYKKDSSLTFCSALQHRRKMSAIEILECCRNIHVLPVENKYVKYLHDYWWSSYKDYMKKYSTGIVNPSLLIMQLDKNASKAINIFRKFHEDIS